MATLTTRVLNSLGWILSNVVAKNAITLARRIILWRFLLAADFGLNGTVWIVINAMDMLRDMGFSNALVHRKEDLKEAISVTFYANIAIHFAVYLLIFLMAPLVAIHYEEPRLEALLRVTSLVIVIRAIGVTCFTLLRKNFQFKQILLINTIEMVSLTICTILFAWKGHGVWSFVYGSLISISIRVIVLWVICPLRLGRFDMRVAKEMFGFAKHMTISTLTIVLIRSLPTYFVGKYLGMAACGFYVEAERIASMVSTNVTRMLGSVLFPAFAEIGQNWVRMRRAWGRASLYTMVIIMPLGTGLIVFSQEVMLGFYRQKVLEIAIIPMAFLAVFSTFRGLATTLSDVSKGAGKPWILTHSALLHLLIMAPSLYIAVNLPGYARRLYEWRYPQELMDSLALQGLTVVSGLHAGIALAALVVTGTAAVAIGDIFYLCNREIGITLRDIRAALTPPLAATLSMAMAAYAAKALVYSFLPGMYLVAFFVAGPIGVGVYVAVLWRFFPSVTNDLKGMLRRRKKESGSKQRKALNEA